MEDRDRRYLLFRVTDALEPAGVRSEAIVAQVADLTPDEQDLWLLRSIAATVLRISLTRTEAQIAASSERVWLRLKVDEALDLGARLLDHAVSGALAVPDSDPASLRELLEQVVDARSPAS